MCDEKRKRIAQGKQLIDAFADTSGITKKFSTKYAQLPQFRPSFAEANTPHFRGDPVWAYQKTVMTRVLKVSPPPPKTPPIPPIEPSVSTRLTIQIPYKGIVGAKYLAREPPGTRALKQRRHKEVADQIKFCADELLRVPSPTILDTILEPVTVESPEISRAKVTPEKPSYISPSVDYPPPMSSATLRARRPGTGVIINERIEEDDEADDMPSSPTNRKPPVKRTLKGTTSEQISSMVEAIDNFFGEGEGEGEFEYPLIKVQMEDRSTHMSDDVVLGKLGEDISKASSATSVQERQPYDDVSWCDIPAISKLVQTIRDAQHKKPKPKFKKGALENHSFTKLKQKTLDDFCYKAISGTMHQGDICFSKISKDKQGICMPISAYCYAHINDPKNWQPRNIDEILELGNCLYLKSIAELHMHKNRKELTAEEVRKFIIIGEKKVKFDIDEPDVKGLVRSRDPKIFNLSHGLRVYFLKYCAGILRTENLNVLIWKTKKKCYYFFDATQRKNNLFQDHSGTAVFAKVQKLKAIASIILDRSSVGNSPYNITQIKVVNILGKDEKEAPPYISEHHTYTMLNEKQAVVQGTWDLGDITFAFTRNKQALAMSIIAIAYSKISAPNTWHKKTIDKIMLIGNQFHTVCADAEGCTDIIIDHIPALFTIGPYILNIHIYSSRYADLMFKKGICKFEENLKLFMERHNNCIAQIGKSYIGIWCQRDMYFCFDPYSRNKQGLKCRTGTACVTMNKNVETLVETVLQNFENYDTIFYLHALKIISITRDPAMNKPFPKTIPLNSICMETFKRFKPKRSKIKAIEKPVTANFTVHALKRLLVGEEIDNSSIDLASNIVSILTGIIPTSLEEVQTAILAKARPKMRGAGDASLVDLDSKSLSDTQIAPKRPSPFDEEDLQIDDLDSYELTQEEKELEDTGEEGGGEGRLVQIGGRGEGEGEEGHSEPTYSKYGVAMSQVSSGELWPCYNTKMMNTVLTYCYEILPAIELEQRTKDDRDIIINAGDQDHEFRKATKFVEIAENVQILVARTNGMECVEDNPNFNAIAPYMCIMAAAYCMEVPLYRWEPRTLDFCLKAGIELYKQYNAHFLKIDDYTFELERNNIFGTIDTIINTYIGKGLFDTFPGQRVLEDFLITHVFSQEDVGFITVPYYVAAVFFKRNLFYYFDPHNCDRNGVMMPRDQPGYSCLIRFKSLSDLVRHLVTNLSIRVEENDKTDLEFRLLTLSKPKFILTNKLTGLIETTGPPYDDALLAKTQSMELKRPHNFTDLPDGSQLMRGNINMQQFEGVKEEFAPFICVTAAAVAEKYAIRTWCPSLIDYILSTGYELYKLTRYKFPQIINLDIPKVSLGHTDYKIQVKYVIDAPIKVNILKAAILKIIPLEREWAIITTEVFSCAVFQRNGCYYLFDPFASNEIAMFSNNKGVASLARFKDLGDLCLRIIFNQNSRDTRENVDHIRFILSVCRATRISPWSLQKMVKDELEKEMIAHALEGAEEKVPEADNEQDEEDEEKKDEDTEWLNLIGYQPKGSHRVIEGSKSLARPKPRQMELNDDHFVALVACLMVISKPIYKWDTRTMDRVYDIGHNVYNHADCLLVSKKRTIKNILIGKNFFDVVVTILPIYDDKKNKNFETALKYLMTKRKYCMVQFKQGTYIIYMDTDHGAYHLFHPYKFTFKDENDEEIGGKGGWIYFDKIKSMLRFLKDTNSPISYTFYTFNVINISKAPKSVIVSYQIQEYIRQRLGKDHLTRDFHERESWTNLPQNPWAKTVTDEQNAICIPDRGKWFYWNVEYCEDLYSLMGTIHQTNRELFKAKYRGKQTICNAVCAIGMTGIYHPREWNAQVVDAVLLSGYNYFLKCIEDIREQNHEFEMEDLVEDVEIFPYSFKIRYHAVIEGTMFLLHPKKFNMYKALKYFFADYTYRAGIVCAYRNKQMKRIIAFGKRSDTEYYMFDSQAWGPPMFAGHKGVAYVLRCTTFARLIHIIVLTLRGGDFYIYEVEAYNFTPVKEEEEEKQEEDGGNEEEAPENPEE